MPSRLTKRVWDSGDTRLTRSKNGLGWKLEFVPRAEKALQKLGAVDQGRVRKFLRANIEGCEDPRRLGKPLAGTKSEYWRYPIGDIRVLCRIEEDRVVVVVVEIGHRREVYR